MDLDSDEYGPEVPDRERDDTSTFVSSVAEKDDATLPDASINGDADADLPSADDHETMKSVVLAPLIEEPEVIEDAHFTWSIERWRQLGKKMHSPVFEAGGNKWRILFFPFGQDSGESCSFYLEHYSEEDVPDDWYCCAQFALVLWNPNDPKILSFKTTQHRFTKAEGDWGFTTFENMRKLFTQEWNGRRKTLVENESANMTVYVRVVKDETGILWHTFRDYDSKKETGYVGLKNQGATCYLNSLLQSLYFTNAFRKAVYQIPTENEEDLMNSAYTLQRLFYNLQSSPNAVSTNELTRSFGWQQRHIFEQQDVQELSRKLMERMEEKMKGTNAENVLPRLFCGKVKTYISCINVDYESSRVEDFWDIQLNVRGNKNIEESFKDYVQVEKMDGENQYFAGDQFKLQDANKGVIFQSFPEVLHLQLKRFEYDIERDAMMKINDRYEFPESFDASPYLSEDADKSEPYIYQLHGVLVHSGDLNAGHYYAFIKPTKDGWFYKYDDDRVTRATKREVLEDNFGGEGNYPQGAIKGPLQQQPAIRQNSAYMLVYIRQSRIDEVLLPVTEDDSPPHLKQKIQEENAERETRRKEREEQHLYMNVRVLTDETFRSHTGIDLGLFNTPAETPGAAKNYRVLKSSNLSDLATTVANDLDVDVKMVRFWGMVNRQNKTTRPDTPMTDTKLPLQELYGRLAPSTHENRLWAEVAEEVDDKGNPLWYGAGEPEKKDKILLFLKWFDVENQILRGIGHFYASSSIKAEQLVPFICQKLNWEKAGEKPRVRIYEEIKPLMIEPLNLKATLKVAELQDGDILCIQKVAETKHEDKDTLAGSSFSKFVPSVGSTTAKPAVANAVVKRPTGWIEDAIQFYDYLQHRRSVRFLPHPKNVDPYLSTINMELSLKYSYDQVAARLGEKLGVDPTHLRFHTIATSTGNIKNAVKRLTNTTLSTILNPSYSTFGTNNTKADEICYEVLEMSLSELDTKKPIKVVWLSDGITKDETYDLLTPKTGTVSDIIPLLIKKAQLEDEETGGPIRVLGVHNNKIYKELGRDSTILNISDFVTIVAERVPEEERDAKPDDFIYCFHFQGEPNKAHGVPFKFLIKPDEKFADTKKRLEVRTGLKGKNFEKIKFAVVKKGGSYSKPTYVDDNMVLWDVATDAQDILGLDHPDRTSRNRSAAPDLFLK